MFRPLRIPPLLVLLQLILEPLSGNSRAENAGVASREQTVLDASDYGSFRLEGVEVEKVAFSIQPSNMPGGNSVLRLETKEKCSATYSAQISLRNKETIQAGDVLLAHFYLRTLKSSLESQEGITQLILEDAKTFTKALEFGARALGEWREFFVPFTTTTSYPPGQASIILRAGYDPQIIEVAGLVIKDFGPKENLAIAPTGSVKLSYAGQAPDAPWRTEAESRISKHRKADLTVSVVDGTGEPLPGVNLTVQQIKHSYWFGSAVKADHLVQSDHPESEAKYRAAIKDMFNAVTFENDLKWPFWERNFPVTLASAKWLGDQGIALRGHTLVWPTAKKGLPESLYPLANKPDGLESAILDHIQKVTTRLQPPAAAWDVLNEPFNNHEFMDVLGKDSMLAWFKAAHEGSPTSRLFINDWGIVTSRGTDEGHQSHYEKTIAYLLDNKAPLDGIGLQGHFGQEPTPPVQLLAVLDRFGRLGKEIQMTEYTSQFNNPEDAAIYLRDCLTVFFSHPATSGFILWGFQEGIGMQNKSFLLDKNGSLSPSGKVWKELIFNKWWTNDEALSGADGAATVNGFLGQYRITARSHGKESKVTTELKPGGTVAKLILSDGPAAIGGN